MRWMWHMQEMWAGAERPVLAGQSTKFTGTAGDDRLVGTAGRDTFDVSQGGDDTVRGGDGNDTFVFGSAFTRADVVKGGAGNDKILIAGPYASLIELDAVQLRQVETVEFGGGQNQNYSIVVTDGFVNLRVRGDIVGRMNVDASAVTTGAVKLAGGGLKDTLTGGAGDDRIRGGSGGDILTGGPGVDRFIFLNRLESVLSIGADTIADFSSEDVILLPTGAGHLDQYHFGQTEGRVGDVTASFVAAENRTVVRVFMNSDDVEDMTIYLTGDKSQLDIVHDSRIVLAELI